MLAVCCVVVGCLLLLVVCYFVVGCLVLVAVFELFYVGRLFIFYSFLVS